MHALRDSVAASRLRRTRNLANASSMRVLKQAGNTSSEFPSLCTELRDGYLLSQ
jgi:hypothetical protein